MGLQHEKVVVYNSRELKKLIFNYIEKFGPECDLNFIDVSHIRNMDNMFSGVNSAFNGDISGWDVSHAVTMREMFYGSLFNGDISHWNTSSVTAMEAMFMGSDFKGDISSWDTSNVTSMDSMFRDSRFNGDISRWNVSNVQWMQCMFANSQFNGDISQWDVSNICDANAMFAGSQFLGDISDWTLPKDAFVLDMFLESVIELKGLIPAWHKKMREDPDRESYWWWTPGCEDMYSDIDETESGQPDCEPPSQEELDNLPF